jgi:hypothetical protein
MDSISQTHAGKDSGLMLAEDAKIAADQGLQIGAMWTNESYIVPQMRPLECTIDYINDRNVCGARRRRNEPHIMRPLAGEKNRVGPEGDDFVGSPTKSDDGVDVHRLEDSTVEAQDAGSFINYYNRRHAMRLGVTCATFDGTGCV